MKKNIFALLVCAATTAMVFGCGNGAKKAEDEAAAAAEQARRDSIAAAEQAAKEKTAMDIISILPEEPVFDIVRTSRNWLLRATTTVFSSTGSSTDS